MICTVTLDNCELGHQLLDLRRDLAWHGNTALEDCFHACDDQQCIRDAVFDVICHESMRIDATLLEKSKAPLHIRGSARSSTNTRGSDILNASGQRFFVMMTKCS